MLLNNNLTFAIIQSKSGWRTDLTTRYSEFFAHKINGENFHHSVIFCPSIDEALNTCQTDYLLVQSGGYITFNQSFFDILEEAARENEDLVLGHIELGYDYAFLDPRCLFVNMKLWNELGKPSFVNTQLREGPAVKITSVTHLESSPGQIAVSSEDRIFVAQECGQSGADLLIKQLDKFGKATSLAAVCDTNQAYYLSTKTAYFELHTETVFEKNFLGQLKSTVLTKDLVSSKTIPNIPVHTVVAPARGLKALDLAEHFNAKQLIVYDANLDNLELQKLIFSIEKPTIFGHVVEQFKQLFPNAVLDDSWRDQYYCAITPLKRVTVEFKHVDPFSFQMEELIKSVNHSYSAVFDLSDCYVNPINYYKHQLYQVEGFFAEIYSLMKSRSGPTFILGLGPGFRNMDVQIVNTSVDAYKLDHTFVPEEDESKEGVIDEVQVEEPVKVEEEVQVPAKMSADVVLPEMQTIDIANVEVVPVQEEKEEIVVTRLKQVGNEPVKEEPPVVQQEIVEPPPVVVQAPEPIKEEPKVDLTFVDDAKSKGYSADISEYNIVLIKSEQLPGFDAIYEYHVNPQTMSWSFKVGTVGNDKRVQFGLGNNLESLQKHIDVKHKINPRTVAKFFV